MKATEIFNGLAFSCWSLSVQQMWNAQGFSKPVINGDNAISVPEPKLLLLVNILCYIFFISTFVWVLCSALSHNLTLMIAHQVSNEVWYLLLANWRQSHSSKPTTFTAILVYLVRISFESCDFTKKKMGNIVLTVVGLLMAKVAEKVRFFSCWIWLLRMLLFLKEGLGCFHANSETD